MTFASVSQFHVYLPWGQRLAYCLKCESTSRHFQPGEGLRGLLRDCKTLRNLREGLFEALEQVEDGIIQ